MADNEILYQSDSTDLKNADRKPRAVRSVLIFLLDIAILYGLFFILIILGLGNILILMIIFVGLSILLLPAPILITPGSYRILPRGVDTDGKRLIPLKASYKTKVNSRRKYVSILHQRRGEFMRLYSREPQDLQRIIQKVIGRKK